MLRAVIIVLCGLALAASGQTAKTSQKKSGPAAAKTQPTARKSQTPSAASKPASPHPKSTAQGKSTPPKTTAKTSSAAKKQTTSKARTTTAKRRAVRRPTVQQQPTKERYAEIQQALIDRGFLEGPASGIWDKQSIEALKRFQQSEQLEPTGKITALSLIRLGLGPKRNDVASNGGGLPPTEAGVNP